MRRIIIIAHNLRSAHNIGSLLRTADGLGVQKVILTGHSPYPQSTSDDRLPHLAQKIHNQIHKTALGAEYTQLWSHDPIITDVLQELKRAGYTIAALEQTTHSVALPDYIPPSKLAIIIGREVEGIEPDILALCGVALEIPMFGSKESFNVIQAAAIALYHCRFAP